MTGESDELAAKFACDAARAWAEVIERREIVSERAAALKNKAKALAEYDALKAAKAELVTAEQYHAELMAEQTPLLPGMERARD